MPGAVWLGRRPALQACMVARMGRTNPIKDESEITVWIRQDNVRTGAVRPTRHRALGDDSGVACSTAIPTSPSSYARWFENDRGSAVPPVQWHVNCWRNCGSAHAPSASFGIARRPKRRQPRRRQTEETVEARLVGSVPLLDGARASGGRWRPKSSAATPRL